MIVSRPPFMPFTDPNKMRLPGLAPLDVSDWISALPDLPEQLAYRARLIATSRAEVIGALPGALAAVEELLETCLAHLMTNALWEFDGNEVRCPGGTKVAVDRTDPLGTLGKLVSEDLCVLERRPEEAEYRLTAGVLCFPAYWSLAEKLGQPLTTIHGPVPVYDADLARRVNRVFDAVQPDRILMRYNWGLAPISDLHTPPRARNHWPELSKKTPLFLRTERQTLLRLPVSQAVVFGIKSSVSPFTALSSAEAAAMLKSLVAQSPQMRDYKGGARLFELAQTQLECLASGQD